MMPDTTQREYGLLPLPPDERDFSHEMVFGSVGLADLPEGDFFTSEPVEIKNQDINYRSDFCASYGAAAVSEDQEATPLVPEYTFAKAKQMIAEKKGATTEEEIEEVLRIYGLNLRDICKAGCKYGFLERAYDLHHCDTQERPDRNFLANWKNWPADLEMLAFEHRKNSFFAVDGPYDTFDNYRAVLFKNRSEQRSIVTGANWRESWTNAPGGYIDVDIYDSAERGSGHAFKIFGQMQAKGKLWLVAQLSNGPETGDKGIYYFSREVVNKEFVFGGFTFKDMPKERAAYHAELGIPVNAALWLKAWKVLCFIFRNLKK